MVLCTALRRYAEPPQVHFMYTWLVFTFVHSRVRDSSLIFPPFYGTGCQYSNELGFPESVIEKFRSEKVHIQYDK